MGGSTEDVGARASLSTLSLNNCANRFSSTGGACLKRLSSFDNKDVNLHATGAATGQASNCCFVKTVLARSELTLQDGFKLAMCSKSWIMTMCTDQLAVVTLNASLNCKNPHWGRAW